MVALSQDFAEQTLQAYGCVFQNLSMNAAYKLWHKNKSILNVTGTTGLGRSNQTSRVLTTKMYLQPSTSFASGPSACSQIDRDVWAEGSGIKPTNRKWLDSFSSVRSFCHDGLEGEEAKGLRWEWATWTFSMQTPDWNENVLFWEDRAPPPPPVSQAAIRRRIENCSIYTEWKGCARLSLNPLVCSIHLHFLCVLPVGYPLHGKHFIMGYLVPVWFRFNGWKMSDSAVVIVGGGANPIQIYQTKWQIYIVILTSLKVLTG